MQALRLKLKKIGQCPALQKLIKFFDGNLYPAIYAALAFFSALFGLEIFFYSITVAIIVFTCLFSSDTKPIIAPVVLTVYSTSWKHTPQPPYNSAFFNSANVLITISVLAVLAVAAMVFRLLIFKNEGGLWLKKRESGVLSGLTEFYNTEEKLSAAQAETFLCAAGLQNVSLKRAGTHKHVFTHLIWHMTAYIAETGENIAALPAFSALRFYTKEEAEKSISLPSAFRWCLKFI